MIKICFILFFFVFLASGCNKDKPPVPDTLEGDKEILIGNWNWTHSYYKYNSCVQCCTLFDTLYSETNDIYRMEIKKDGYIKFFKNDIESYEKSIFY